MITLVQMPPCWKPDHKPTPEIAIPTILFTSVLVHRLIQLYLLWPQLLERPVHANQLMQLLPAAVWREHFAAGLLYLQQAPPLPNLVFGVLAWLIPDAQNLALAILGLQIFLACISAALLASLLLRLRLPSWVCLLAPGILFFSGDLIVMEYNVMGHFFYEQSTMLLCLLASHSALSFQRSAQARSILLLGLWVALLALTRSTFSYFALPVVLWMLVFSPRKRLASVLIFLVPVVILHGGWSLKNKLAHGYWSVATSSWGGANAHTGDLRRSGEDAVREWMRGQDEKCDPAYWQMVQQYGRSIFFFPDKDWFLSFPQPQSVLEANQRAVDARGQLVFFDTDTVRHYSHCLQQVYMAHWLRNPVQTLRGAWDSYLLFWIPIREFVSRNPVPIAPPVIHRDEKSMPDPVLWLRRGVEELGDNTYRYVYADIQKWPDMFVYRDISAILVLPALPLLFQAVNVVMIHGFVLYLLAGFICRRSRFPWQEWRNASFPLLCVFYVAGLTSLVEFGENMRFRLEVEPLVWALSLLILNKALAGLRGYVSVRQ